MKIFKKEKQVADLALDHVDKTSECLAVMCEAIRAYMSGDYATVASASSRGNTLETDADKMLRDIRELLYSGAFLPTIRGDIYQLASAVDNVANKAEDCLDFVNFQKPQMPEEYRPQIRSIVELTEGCFSELGKALRAYYDPKEEMDQQRAHTRRVSELESLIDDDERALTTQIFESSMPLCDKIHFRQFLTTIVCISDVIEDAADELQLVSLKSII